MNSFFSILILFISSFSFGQLFINEGSNKNYSVLPDEDGDYEDWIEIYNSGTTAIDLFNYSLSDNSTPGEWSFPHQIIQPNEYIIVFCSEKNRFASTPFTNVLIDSTFQPQPGWNTHYFTTPFFWDGVSNIVLNLCTYNSFYECNSIHSQSTTNFNSATIALNYPGSACGFSGGSNAQQRPNIRFNSSIIGTGTIQNGYYDYPSAYSNWYEGARQQYLYSASELISAGLSPGNIDSLSFDVIATCPTSLQFIELSMSNTGINSLSPNFVPATGNFQHTNFKISSTGETIKLYNPSGTVVSALNVNCGPGYDISVGHFLDGSGTLKRFSSPTPGVSNNFSIPSDGYAAAPVFSINSGIFPSPISVTISDPNNPNATIYYTLDGSDPNENSSQWNGTPIYIFQSKILRARSYLNGLIPSTITSASYLFNVNHTTPIISLVSDPQNLYGPTGMFDNPTLDLLKTASVDYFDSTLNHNLLFSQRAGIIMDGGWGARGKPQRPFRIKWDDGVLGEGPVYGNIIPDRTNRTIYSDFYLRNGSNLNLILPYKDGVQGKMMGEGTFNYYSASRPVSLYVNGVYWGLYDLREKFNTEMFEIYDGASENTIEILGSTAQYGFQLRAVEGDVQNFYNSYNNLIQLNPLDTSYWSQADQYFDLNYLNDYWIGEVWMNNVDWVPGYNNIKIYRSDATNYRWRYCLMDLEYGLLPNDYSTILGSNELNCAHNYLSGLLNWPASDPNNPHVNIWMHSLQNERFKNYFINRFADQMNTVYLPSRLLEIENDMFNRTVSEMANEYERWGDPNNVQAQVDAFYQYHLIFQEDLVCRPENMRNHIQTNFNLPQQVNVQLNVYPQNAGKIEISTITPNIYPWNGIYFDGVPIQLEAQAEPGYQFSHWEANNLISDTTNAIFLDTLTNNSVNFIAHFISTVDLVEIPNSSILIYPNPTKDILHITGLSENIDSEIKVFNPLGQLVYSGITANEINVGNLAKGWYILTIEDRGITYKTKFIKE
ncbi:MAG: lamin tail domain-containing protein [Flavobacteriia bacterium]